MKLHDRGRLDADAIYVRDLQESFARIKALKQLVVMDACQSGGATEVLAVRGDPEEKALAQLARSAGVHVLAASGSQQVATEFQALGHGVFTYALLAGLNGAADGVDQDGTITVAELWLYVYKQVPLLSEQHKGKAQWPTGQLKGQDFPVVVK